MSYGFNLSKVSLNRYKRLIKEGYLIPSMRKLLVGIDQNFQILKSHNLSTVADLEKRISNQKKADLFAEETGIGSLYMTALRRLVSSYKAKPRKLAEFPQIENDSLLAMEQQGIKTSKTLFEYMKQKEGPVIMEQMGFSKEDLQLYWSLMEVTQLRYVSPLFATAMVMSGHNSIKAVAAAESSQFLKSLVQVNTKHNIYKGNIGDSDMQFLIDDARFFLEIQSE